MTILVEFTISTEHFELGSYVADGIGLSAELERIVPTQGRAIPYVWVTGSPAALESLTDTFRGSDKISSVSTLDEFESEAPDTVQQLYRIEWLLGELDIIKGIIEADGAVLEGYSEGDYWFLRFRFPRNDDVAQFYQYLINHGSPVCRWRIHVHKP